MNGKIETVRPFFCGLFVLFILATAAWGQGYEGIIPARASCDEVKRHFGIEQCNYPLSTFEVGKSRVRIEFTKKLFEKRIGVCWNLQPKTVFKITLFLDQPIPLKDFDYPLSFVRGPIDDIFTNHFENKSQGINAYIVNGMITRIEYLPSESDLKQFSFVCWSAMDIDGIELPSNWIERYWDVSEEKQKLILDHAIKEFKSQPFYTTLYIVCFYKNEEDKLTGLRKSHALKEALETNDEFSGEIKIFSGGRMKKSEIVLYPIGPAKLF